MCYFLILINLSILSVCLSIYLPIYLPIYLFVCLSVYSICLFDLLIRSVYLIRLFNLPPIINTRADVIFQHINYLSTLPSYPIYLSNLSIQFAYLICLLNLPI